MRLIRTAAPSETPVSLAEVKAQTRVDDSDEDALISMLIDAATARLDGINGLLGRALVRQSWALTLDGFTPAVELPLPPLVSVDAVIYRDATGSPQTLASSFYSVSGMGDAGAAVLRPVGVWPATDGKPDTVTISFTAGYGDAADVPAPLRQAILMHVAHLFENREAGIDGEGAYRATPFGWHDLTRDYRLWGF